MVDKYTGEILADGAVEKHGGNRRVNTAAQSEHHLVVTELLAESLDGRFDK